MSFPLWSLLSGVGVNFTIKLLEVRRILYVFSLDFKLSSNLASACQSAAAMCVENAATQQPSSWMLKEIVKDSPPQKNQIWKER